MTPIDKLKTHLAEQIALADKIGDCTVFMQSREDFIARNKERRQLKVALEVIEERPHEALCGWLNTARPCTCWKSRAIARILEAGGMTPKERLLAWRSNRIAEAVDEGKPTFMGLPDEWYDARTLGCESGHVSHRYLGTEQGGMCLACHKPVYIIPPIEESELEAIVNGTQPTKGASRE